MATTWPPLPETLKPDHAYGLLQIREKGRLRESLLATVNLGTGAVKTQDYLSRTAYDWVCDEISFRVYKQPCTVALEEGEVDDFVADEQDLPELRQAWAQAYAKLMSRTLPRAGKKKPAPRPRL